MKLEKKITIITPTFNSSKTILSNLKSVKNQKFKNFEHLIIDNDSKDGTKKLVKKKINKKTRIISEKDNGIYDAMNKGLKRVRANDFVLFLNAGDEFTQPDILQKVIDGGFLKTYQSR